MPEPAGYAPLGAVERQRRRALFLQSYQFSVERRQGPAEWLGLGLGGRLARRLREVGGAVARAAGRVRGAARWWVGAGLARAWRGWRPRADPLLGCFGSAAHHKYYLHDYA
ncbi:unnamed protein product [Miscanthus lutarioriparius]|uniref:Uncharacterized protein n=1 Tax=Miscanthus lutarioriparius TaxID=422564 RepID=A0A811NHX0_9POAL|nr:unnamed protein product [Miscanthus lutarioriparius]